MQSALASVPRRKELLAAGFCRTDQDSLRRISAMFWSVKFTTSLFETVEELKSGSWPVVLCESTFSNGVWRVLMDTVICTPDAARLVVASSLADDFLWAEVLNRGGFDVLALPFEPLEVRTVLVRAFDSWNVRNDRALARVRRAEAS